MAQSLGHGIPRWAGLLSTSVPPHFALLLWYARSMARYSQVGVSFGPPITPMVKRLVMVIGAAFLLTYIPAVAFGWKFAYDWFSLVPYLVVHRFFVWQLATYLFLHGGWFHV